MKIKKYLAVGLAGIVLALACALVPPATAEAQEWDPLAPWTDSAETGTAGMDAELVKCAQIRAQQQFLLDLTPVPGIKGILFIPGASVVSAGMLGMFEVTLMVSDWDELDCKNRLAAAGL